MDALKYCRPEEIGASPVLVSDYINEMNRRGKMCHSFLMMRRGKVFAEGYWAPFHKEWKHRMYSVSKTFVSAAIGFLADEGRIKLTDKICDYFPDKLPENLDPLIAEMTIRDMLMMATCHSVSTYRRYDPDWLATFFEPHKAPDRKAGTSFRYDTSATYTLDVLVERLTGKTFLDYLKDKGLRELGFSEDAWCVEAPEGYAWGGSGVMCTTRDLARFALLFDNDGVVNGKQYLSKEYVRAATSKQIENPGADDPMHSHGYGYQIWRTWKNTFSFCGMGGQLAIHIPEKDFLFVCTSDMQGDPDNYQMIYNVLWDTVIDHLSDEPVPADDAAYARMNVQLGSLTVTPPTGIPAPQAAADIDGVTYKLGDNPMGIRSFVLRFTEGGGELCLDTDRGEKRFPFGIGHYVDTDFPETHYYGRRIGTPADRPYRCLHAGLWKDESTFRIRSYLIDDYFGNMWTTLAFDGDRVHLKMTKTAEFFLDEYEGEADGSRA